MDAFVRRYIHESLCYRFVMLPDQGRSIRSGNGHQEWRMGAWPPPAQSAKVTIATLFWATSADGRNWYAPLTRPTQGTIKLR